MAMNFAYIHLVKTGLGLPDAAFEMAKRPELFAWVLLAICIQPAIVEELFFRYLALGHLRTILGTSGAVIVSGVMFGLAHINNPLGIPYLIVMGIGLSMIRVAGRSLAIPILIHFAHNAMVLWWEPWL
jgi:membrane protease YdiL (CAAX protease family)